MNIKLNNDYYGFNIKKTLEYFNGTRFLGEMTLFENYIPVSVYYSKNPDKSKNHKNIFFVYYKDTKTYVSGMSLEDFEKYRYQTAVYCKKCKEVIYSTYMHDFRPCKCAKIAIDGGREYDRICFEKDNDFECGKIDFLEGKFIKNKE